MARRSGVRISGAVSGRVLVIALGVTGERMGSGSSGFKIAALHRCYCRDDLEARYSVALLCGCARKFCRVVSLLRERVSEITLVVCWVTGDNLAPCVTCADSVHRTVMQHSRERHRCRFGSSGTPAQEWQTGA